MRPKHFLPVAGALAATMTAAEAPCQSIAYINLLQFDLQSFRSQATGGIFLDDVDLLGNAARLQEIEGRRVFTNFSNLSDPATLGDNLITYSLDRTADFTTNPDPRPGMPPADFDTFDSGSYLGGWVGKRDEGSELTFSVIYQGTGHKAMFEDLEDASLGGPVFGQSTDARYSAVLRSAFDNGAGGNPAGDGRIDREIVTETDLARYDDRSAGRFDFGVARDFSGGLSAGGRFFYRNDRIGRHAGGSTVVITREKQAVDGPDGPLRETGRTITTWTGDMDDAFKMKEVGVSLDADWHPSSWAFNARLDVFRTNITNPSTGTSLPTRAVGNPLPDPVSGNVPALQETEILTVVTPAGGFNPNSLGDLDSLRVQRSWSTQPFSLGTIPPPVAATESVDDERTGTGFAGLFELDRPWAGGDTRTWVGFNRRPVEVDVRIVSVQRQGSTFWWNDAAAGTGDVEANDIVVDETTLLTRRGDARNTVLEAGAKWWRELSDRVDMGLGFVLTRTSWDEEFRQTSSTTRIENAFDDGLGEPGGNELESSALGGAGTYTERRTLIESVTTHDIDDGTRETTLRLPVGAQFKITRNIKWQMGVLHAIHYWTRETSRTVPGDAAGWVRTTVSDFVNPDDVTYSQAATGSGTETLEDKSRFDTTTFWYGVEWLVGDVAQFNINGFFDTHGDSLTREAPFSGGGQILDVDFFRNLAVSLTFLFD